MGSTARAAADGDQARRRAGRVRDRRDRRRQRPLLGGARQSDPPLTTRDCADWMGLTTAWIRDAIDHGVPRPGPGTRTIRLEAESITVNGRRVHRIYLEAFIAFLQGIGWRRIPKRPGVAPGPS